MVLQTCDSLRLSAPDKHLLFPYRAGIAAQGPDDRQLCRLGAGRLVHEPGAAVGTAEGGGDPALTGEDVAQGRAAAADAMRAQAATDQPKKSSYTLSWVSYPAEILAQGSVDERFDPSPNG